MATVTGSSVSQWVPKRYRPVLPLITCGKCGQKIVMEYKVSKEGANKGGMFYKCLDCNVSFFQTFAYICAYFLTMLLKLLILSSNFSGTVPADVRVGTGRKNTFNTSRNLLHRRLRRKKPIDVDQANDLSIIVGIGRELIMLLKCILVLVCLVLIAIVFVVARLA